MSLPLWFIANFGFTVLVTGLAFVRGGPPERATGLFLFAATILTYLLNDRRWIDVQFAVMGLDIFGFLIFTALALFADRWWPMWAAGLQGLCVAIHLAFWVQYKVISLVYVTALNMIGYALLLTLLLGTLAHMRRRRLAAGSPGQDPAHQP